MMNRITRILLGSTLVILISIPIFATTLPGDLRIYVGVDTSVPNSFYICTNVKDPSTATLDEKFSIENVCFYYDAGEAGVTYNTTYPNTQYFETFHMLSFGYSSVPIVSFEFLAGAHYVKSDLHFGNIQNPFTTLLISSYHERLFINTYPTGYIKMLFNKAGTYKIRYLAVDKAYGPEPFIIYGPLLSKEEVANEPPKVTIFSPAPGTQLLETTTVDLIFQAVDPENRTMTCYYYVNGIEHAISVASGENVSIALTIDYMGNITIKVVCRDPFGATGSAVTYVLRETPPSVTIITPYSNQLITNNSLSVTYMVSDNGPWVVCNLSILNTNISKIVNITLPDKGVATQSDVIYLTDIPDGKYYTLQIQCNDSVGLSRSSQVSFEYALDPDRSERWCTSPEIGGEWYGDHCCGDDAGEYRSTDAKGWPTPQAFDPATCTLIDLTPGQCDDVGDCPPSGWFCTNETFRELREYTCVKEAGQLIGYCQETILQYENCSAIDPSYICSNGICASTAVPNQPPTITIHYPQEGQVIKVTIYKKYLLTNVTITDDNSLAVVCNLTLNDNIINLGILNVSQTYTFNVTGIVNGTNTLSITCMDAYNDTSTATVHFTVEVVPAECVVDSDCGADGWYCISSTERAYIDYSCVDGKCEANITQTETAPAGYICVDGQFVNESTLTCTSDEDCPPDDRVCTSDRTGYIIRDWYCDAQTGVCKYNITQTVYCGANEYCLAGVCWPKGEKACEGMILTFCTSNTTYMELVAVYKEDLDTCVYIPAGEFNCPAGTVCFAGKCSTTPTGNLPPVITYNITKKSIKVGETTLIEVTVTDDNTYALFVNVTVQAPEIIQIFKGVVVAGKTFTVKYTPTHASTHILAISAIDQYGVIATEQATIEVQEVAAAERAAAAAAAAGAAGGAAAAAIPPAPPKIPMEIIIIVLIAVVGAGAVIYYYYKGRW